MRKLGSLSVIAALAIFLAALNAQAKQTNNFETIAASSLKDAKKANPQTPKIKEVKAHKIDLGDILFPDRGRRGPERGRDRGRGRNDRWRGPGNGRDRGRGRGRQEISCSATDKGWEEHWGGHRSRGFNLPQLESSACSKCFKKHGTCNFRCVTEETRCTARFKSDDGTFDGEVYGDTWPRRFDAEDSAMDRCWRRNRGRAGRCELTGRCDNVGRTQSSGRCRK